MTATTPARPTRVRRAAAAAIAGAALVLSACGGSTVEVNRDLAVQTPGPDAVVTTHTSGDLSLSVRRPGVLDRGIVRFEITVRADGEAVTGMRMIATSDMPTMNHPQELEPDADEQGLYTLDVPLGMPGEWIIELDLEHEDHPDLDPVELSITVREPQS